MAPYYRNRLMKKFRALFSIATVPRPSTGDWGYKRGAADVSLIVNMDLLSVPLQCSAAYGAIKGNSGLIP
jgi:hypothetical protein